MAAQDNIQEIVRAAQTQLINDNLDNVLYNQRRKIELAKDVLSKEGVTPEECNEAKTILELADKAENRIGQGIGIFPTHTQSVQYIQLTAGRDMILSDDVLDIIGKHVSLAIEGEVEEAIPDK